MMEQAPRKGSQSSLDVDRAGSNSSLNARGFVKLGLQDIEQSQKMSARELSFTSDLESIDHLLDPYEYFRSAGGTRLRARQLSHIHSVIARANFSESVARLDMNGVWDEHSALGMALPAF